MDWDTLKTECLACTKCELCSTRTNVVFGQGAQNAEVLFVGEGPGEQEDLQGVPFVGPAGKLLDDMLSIIDLDREKCYIANIVKCRPPQNRVPTDEEAAACKLHLRIQTALIRPKVIVLLGSTAAKNIIGADIRITRDRGKWFERKGIWMMATYHPSALLRDPSKKRDAWEDMQSLRDRLMDLGLYNDIYQEQTP